MLFHRNQHRQLIERFAQRIPGFNQRSLSFDDLAAFCDDWGIEIIMRGMREHYGATLAADGQPYIYINKLLEYPLRVFALGHELTHATEHLLDTEIFASTGNLWNRSKYERQANIIGALCLMPDSEILQTDMTIEQIAGWYGVTKKLAKFRVELAMGLQ